MLWGAMIDTRHVAGRRSLRFDTLDAVLADAESMASRPHRTLGNWTLGQICWHLARWMHACIDGFGFGVPLLLRPFLRPTRRWIKHNLLTRGMSVGIRLKGGAADQYIPPPIPDEEGVESLRRAIARLKADARRHPSPLLGPMTCQEWDQWHCRHAELHLSFVVTTGA